MLPLRIIISIVVIATVTAIDVTESQPKTLRKGSFRNVESRQQLSHPASVHCEYKELMTNLHDRVGVLASLDEDQRNRLESIDKKLSLLVDSNTARMESIKAQQMDFQKRLDTFEHIQRLSRNTLDEIKGETIERNIPRGVRELQQKRRNQSQLLDLSRNTRDTSGQLPQYAQGVFNENPQELTADASTTTTSRANDRDFMLDVPQRLEALATLLASTAINLNALQRNVSHLVQTTNVIQRRLSTHRRKGQQGAGWIGSNPVSAPLPAPEPVTSCAQSEPINGILKLQLTPESEPFYVPCENDGWTVIMRRFSGNLNFERSWLEYKEGFGNLAGEFFIGLDKLHALTASNVHELRVLLEDFEGNQTSAGYSLFAIGSEKELYPLNLLGSVNSDNSVGDSLSYHAGAKFSTFDHDNDNCVECNCALKHKGGWWYNWCATTNLHGTYHSIDYTSAGDSGIFWASFHGVNYSLKRVAMLIRPVEPLNYRR